MPDTLDGLKAPPPDRCAIERELRRGGAAVVHVAHDTRLVRQTSAAVLRQDPAASLCSKRFLREMQISCHSAPRADACLSRFIGPPTDRSLTV